MARYRKSCEAKLIQARPETKKYYSAIRNALMGYEGTKERMSWTIDTYTNEHTQIAKINVRPRTLDLYLALEPSTLEDSVYRGKDVGGKKKYAETPFLYKVNSPRKLTLALELVQRACEEQGLSPIDIEEINYEEQYPFTDTETLITRGLIREYLREEKPAVTFELDPDHVPQLIEEDETVIPANANFIWEFDNDQPEVEEPIAEEVVEEAPVIEEPVVEEPIVEEEPVVEEPIVEEPVAEKPYVAPGTTTTTTTTHETIRTTNGRGAEINEKARTIEVLPEPAVERIAIAEQIAPKAVEEPIVEEIAEEIPTQEVVEEVIEEIEAPVEEIIEEEIIDDEIEEEIEETTAEQAAQIQSAVAALFGDDIFEEDEPIEEEPVVEVVEEEVEEIVEEIIEEEPEEEIVEEIIEEEPEEEIVEEIVEEVIEEEIEEIIEEEPVEDEIVEEIIEEVIEEEPEAEAEEEYYEEVYEEVYEEEPEAEAEEEYYEEVYEEVYEEEPEAETEEEYYEEVYEEVYEEEPETEEVEEEYYEEVYEEVYEEEPEEVYEDEEYYEEVIEVEEEEEAEVEEKPAAPLYQASGDVVLLDVCVFDDYFDNGAIVNLETLKQVGLAPENATRLKVYATGELKGQFTVEANHFTLDAIKAIGDADGDSIMIR